MTQQINRGEVYYADLSPAQGSEQDGYRPVLVVQNQKGNRHSPTTQVVPITTQHKKSKLPTHVTISKFCGLDSDSIALAEQLRTIDKERLGEYVGEVSSDELALVEKAMAVSLGLKPPKSTIWDITLCSRCKANFEHAGRLLVKRGFSETLETCDYCNVGKGLTYGVF